MSSASEKPDIAYRAFGGALLGQILPTAASAGLMILIIRSYDWLIGGDSPDLYFAAGWFAAILFVVSLAHAAALRRQRWLDLLLDLLESAAMIYVFVALGLVGRAPEPLPHFYGALCAFLVIILARRWDVDSGQAPADDHASTRIRNLTIFACIVLFASIFLSKPIGHAFDVSIIVVLWGILAGYLYLVVQREKARGVHTS